MKPKTIRSAVGFTRAIQKQTNGQMCARVRDNVCAANTSEKLEALSSDGADRPAKPVGGEGGTWTREGVTRPRPTSGPDLTQRFPDEQLRTSRRVGCPVKRERCSPLFAGRIKKTHKRRRAHKCRAPLRDARFRPPPPPPPPLSTVRPERFWIFAWRARARAGGRRGGLTRNRSVGGFFCFVIIFICTFFFVATPGDYGFPNATFYWRFRLKTNSPWLSSSNRPLSFSLWGLNSVFCFFFFFVSASAS